VLVHFNTVVDLFLEEIGIVFVEYLSDMDITLSVPAFPHRPLLVY